MNTIITRSISTSIVGLALLLPARTLLAAEPGPPVRSLEPSVTVRWTDLNPATPEGSRALYVRVRAAVDAVCGPRTSVWDPKRTWEWKDCYAQTLESAVSRLNLPLVTALHASTTHRALPGPSLQAGNR
jgi:UrcA family protein